MATVNDDLSSPGDRSDAKAQLDRALDRNDAELLAPWARRYGPSAIEAIEAGELAWCSAGPCLTCGAAC